jgi:hypothetical protein
LLPIRNSKVLFEPKALLQPGYLVQQRQSWTSLHDQQWRQSVSRSAEAQPLPRALNSECEQLIAVLSRAFHKVLLDPALPTGRDFSLSRPAFPWKLFTDSGEDI